MLHRKIPSLFCSSLLLAAFVFSCGSIPDQHHEERIYIAKVDYSDIIREIGFKLRDRDIQVQSNEEVTQYLQRGIPLGVHFYATSGLTLESVAGYGVTQVCADLYQKKRKIGIVKILLFPTRYEVRTSLESNPSKLIFEPYIDYVLEVDGQEPVTRKLYLSPIRSKPK
ncbi:MAG: hypothetical protein RL095_3629 [Verrucomicrobiota bacterium]|jgi:hypothetical protein